MTRAWRAAPSASAARLPDAPTAPVAADAITRRVCQVSEIDPALTANITGTVPTSVRSAVLFS